MTNKEIEHLKNRIEEESRALFNKNYSKLNWIFDKWLGPDNTVEYSRDGDQCVAKWYGCNFYLINGSVYADAPIYPGKSFYIDDEKALLSLIEKMGKYKCNQKSWLGKIISRRWLG